MHEQFCRKAMLEQYYADIIFIENISNVNPILAQYYANIAFIVNTSNVMRKLFNAVFILEIFIMEYQYGRNIGFMLEVF